MSNEAGANSGPHLRRTLTLWDLLLYGIIVLQPVAPMSAFGALSDRGRGHVVTAILIAMVAMLATAVSYGKMAARLSERGLGVYVRGARDSSRRRIHHRVEHGDGLHREPADLHDLVRGAGA